MGVILSLGDGIFCYFVKLIMENCYCSISLRDIEEILIAVGFYCAATTFSMVSGWIG
jgi:hypothetical protein